MSRIVRAGLAACVMCSMSGCRSAFVEADLINQTQSSISVIEVDYPSASFGTQAMQPGGSFHYRFKILGDGPLKLTYTDSSGKEHTSVGPTLHEGAEGRLRVTIQSSDVHWQNDLHQRR